MKEIVPPNYVNTKKQIPESMIHIEIMMFHIQSKNITKNKFLYNSFKSL